MSGTNIRVTLTTRLGRDGILTLTDEHPDGTACVWDAEGGDETVEAMFQLLTPDGESNISHVIDGDDWRTLDDNDLLGVVHFWTKYGPKNLHTAVSCAIEGVDPDGWNYEDELERVEMAAELARLKQLAIYRVFVLQPLRGRERKHTVRIYRVGATSEQDAFTKVKSRLSDAPAEPPGWIITAVTRFGNVDSVMFDNSFTVEKSVGAAAKEWAPA